MTHERYDHGPLVEAWLKEPTFVPAADLTRVSAAIAQTPQRRERQFRLPNLRFQPMLDATKAAAAVSVLAISGTLLASQLMASGPENSQAPAAAVASPSAAPMDTSQRPTPSQAPVAAERASSSDEIGITLPDVLPPGVESGVVQTPDGPARWVHFTPAGGALPAAGRVIGWNDGIAVWDSRLSTVDPAAEDRLQSTTDGITWRPIPLPEDLLERPRSEWPVLQQLDGVTYLYLSGTDAFWASNGGDWRPIDASALSATLRDGWDTSIHFASGLHLVDGRPVIAVRVRHHLPREQLGIPKGIETRRMEDLGRQRYAVCHPDGPCTEAGATRVLRFKTTDDGLVVRNDRTGERLGLMQGATASDLYEGLRGIQRLWFAIDGDQLVPTEEPPAGWDAEPPSADPLPPVEGLNVGGVGSTWVAYGGGFFTPSPEPPWLQVGGEWFDTAEWGVPTAEHEGYAWLVEGAGDTVLLWTLREDGSPDGLWVVAGPADS